jgi:hypothetical protein
VSLLSTRCIYSLDCQDCFNPKSNSVSPEWFERVNDEDPPEGLEIVYIPAVCSDREDEFDSRPMQEQLKIIRYTQKW